ncbi:MAG: alpha/beta hydrolase [Chlamydiales bacterium]|nr:alpha/beta hydrolase [Chlamydiales bacterium]
MKITLEKQTAAFIQELTQKGGAPIYKLRPVEARQVLEKLQSSPIEKADVSVEERVIVGGPKGEVSIHILRPKGSQERLPVIMYFHGAGWVMGSRNTHDRLVRELAVATNSAVVFVNYSRSPEDRFPVAIEEAYTATKYVADHAEMFNLDASRFAVAGDSVGGNMAIAVTLLAKKWSSPKIDCQILFYPVTSAAMNTPSYKQFADGPWLTKPAMEYFWNAYEPEVSERKKIMLSPLLATSEELRDLPPALVITAENDVLRDEGELYAAKLMEAGVKVTATRFLETIHDFLMLNALAETPAARGALQLATTYINEAFNRTAQKGAKTRKRAA